MKSIPVNVSKVGEDNGAEVVVNVHLPSYYNRGRNHATVVLLVWIDEETGDLRVGHYTAGQDGRTLTSDAFQYDPAWLGMSPTQWRGK